MTIVPHDPTAEAAAVLGDGFTGRILEPGRPADTDPEFFADDPAVAGPRGDLIVVTPTTGGDRTWDEIVADRPELADWVGERWLGCRPRLAAVPDGYPAARGGFGTPFHADDEQVRVEHGRLVHQQGDRVDSTAITTLAAGAEFLGIQPGTAAAEHDSPPLGDLDADLGATPDTGAFLAAWFGFAWSVLEELRLTEGAVDVDRTQLWPGHFDPAIAMGDAKAGARATFGASPGDADHPEPYLYVGAWGDVDRGDPYWNEPSFNGASMSYAELRANDDQLESVIRFLRSGESRLRSGPQGREMPITPRC